MADSLQILFASDPSAQVLGRYKSRMAITDADRNAACRLRFNVFNAELGEGLIESYILAAISIDSTRFAGISWWKMPNSESLSVSIPCNLARPPPKLWLLQQAGV